MMLEKLIVFVEEWSMEACLEQLLPGLLGYFSTGLRKLECARAVARHMRPERNGSRGFQAFWEALAACSA